MLFLGLLDESLSLCINCKGSEVCLFQDIV